MANFSVIRDTPAPESSMARALAVRWSLSKVTVMVLGNPVSRPRSVSTEMAAWVVGVGAGDGGGGSRLVEESVVFETTGAAREPA